MFANWFKTRSPRSRAQENRFRPQLEYLEGRLAPSALGFAHDKGGGNDEGGGNDQGGGPPGQGNNNHDNNHVNIHINQHDNFNLDDDNAFGVALNNISVNQSLFAFGTPQAQLTELLFVSLGQAVVTTPGATVQDALTLVTQEFQLGQDTGMLLTGILSGGGTNAGLVQTIHNLQASIQTNPLEASAAGQLAGTLAFDIGLNASLPQLQGH